MLEIPALVTSAWTLLQPLLPVIAAKGAEKLGEAAGTDLWKAIQKKFDLQAAAKARPRARRSERRDFPASSARESASSSRPNSRRPA